ncbi:competence protein ComGF [Streptococcus gallolyticus]|uniref:competence type IV pilus minor pilin ComGF n=1 Tax=Streptococcus hepaticus TaxID=3349163 RepID=UPI001C959A56|nr:competence protein ComGF [Streptococcus gallolyticus]MBY5040841.1 competence protein ComGF [Streptococcus gallolyticus]
MWKKTRKVAAFTILECLVSLFILSGSVLLFQGLTQLFSQEIHHQNASFDRDWLVFSEQFRSELDGLLLTKIENNRLYVKKNKQELAFGLSKSDDFRKTNQKGQGYQPMLYGLKSVTMRQDGQLVRIDFCFENGEKRSFVYDFSEKS